MAWVEKQQGSSFLIEIATNSINCEDQVGEIGESNNSLELTAKVSSYATTMAHRYLSARQKLAIFDGLIADEVNALFKNTYGAHAYNALRLTLILDLIRDTWAFVLDVDPRSPSLSNVWAQILSDNVRKPLRDVAARPRKGSSSFGEGWTEAQKQERIAKWDKEDTDKQAKAFDDAFDRVSATLPAFIKSELAVKIDRARKKTIAHYDMVATKEGPKQYQLAEIGLNWGDPKLFLDQLGPILWDVVLLATWGSYAVEDFERTSRLYAADFWSRLRGNPPVEDA